MITSNKKMTLLSDVEKVWSVVTDLKDCAWRSDLSRIEILEDGKRFIEYTKDGYPTTFTITVKEPYRLYEFELENGNMTGTWRGIFTALPNGTLADFTEEITVKKPVMKLFAKFYLKSQQSRYYKDLKAKLGE